MQPTSKLSSGSKTHGGKDTQAQTQYQWSYEWTTTLTCPSVRKLESLQGLTLILQSFGTIKRTGPLEVDIMKSRFLDLSKVIRAFQQHELRERLVTVALLPQYLRVSELGGMQEAIRGLLLQPHARRHAKCGPAKSHLAEITRRQSVE